MNYRRWLNSKLGVFAYCLASLFLLIACGSADVSTSINNSNFSSNNIQYVANVTIDETTTQAGLEAETGGEVILFKPEAGFAVVGFDKPLDSLSTLAGDATENQDVFSQPEFASQAFDGSGHSAWAGGHSAWAGGWSAWAGGWSAWAGGHSAWAGGDTIPALPQENQSAWDMLHLEEAHMLSQKFGEGATVAVIDTGLDLDHPMFQGRLAPSSQWRDFVDNDNDPSEVSDGAAYGHGTGVAGIILQVAPMATILPIRVLDKDGFGDTDDILLAIDHAINMGVDVINLSLGTNVLVVALQDMLEIAEDQGIYTITSSGNGGSRNDTLYPARFFYYMGTTQNLLNVGSVNAQGGISDFTSYATYSVLGGSEDLGRQWYSNLENAAFGEKVVSAYPDGRLAAYTGTSFATPLLAGAIALAAAEVTGSPSYSNEWGEQLILPDAVLNHKTHMVNAAETLRRQPNWQQPLSLNSPFGKKSITGSWSRSGGQSDTSNNNPRYSFSVNQNDLVAIDLQSSTDTYLYLLDSSGRVVARDDNSGAGNNARIIKNLSQGSYSIVAATVKKSQKTSFEVVVYGDVSNLN